MPEIIRPTMSTPPGNANQDGSEQQCHPRQSENSSQQRKEGDAEGSQPPNLDASSMVRAGGYPDPRRPRPISTRGDDLRLGVGRLGLWHCLLFHNLIPLSLPASCGTLAFGRQSGDVDHRREREVRLGPAFPPSEVGPAVRIRFAPALSHERTGPAAELIPRFREDV
jgi:hypothetical protein